MSSLSIYAFGTTILRAVVQPDDQSQQSVSLMREDTLTVNFDSTVPIPFQIGDYCTFLGKLYQINQLPKRTRKSTRRISYVVIFEAEYYDLAKVAYLFLDASNNFTEPVFSLRGTLEDFADLIVFNLKRVFPTANWILGTINSTDYATISFSAQNCLQVLQTIATTFNTEYFVEGKTINIYQRQTSSRLIFKYGKNNPLLNLTEEPQTSANVITRLYAYGSTKNIAPTYRDGAQRLRMGTTPYLEKNVSIYRTNEFTILFDGTNGTVEIYPHRTGTITGVDDLFNFEDADIDFDVNAYLISGVTAQLTFNTGLLSGYTFTISAFDNSTKKFTLNLNSDDPNFVVPSTNFHPQVGDTYVITNIDQPASYIADAEAQLKAAAQDYIDKNSIPPVAYSGDCNINWFRDNNPPFTIAQTAQVLDVGLGINKITRITSFTRNINNIFAIGMELSDTVTPQSIIVKILNGL